MRRTAFFAIIIVISLIAACGGNSSRQVRNLMPGTPSSPAQANDSYQLALNSLPADMRAEVDALVLPKGCDPALFYALKKSFVTAMAQKLASGGKIASVPPTGDRNKVTGLYISDVGGQRILNWPYRNIGDYDQNGTVGITDITPIAMHYGHTVGTDPLDIVIDGDGLGSVGISDITPLAINFAVNVTSYRVEEATAEGGPYTALGNVLLTSGTGADQGWMQLQYTLPNDDARWLRVVPVDGLGNSGIPSDTLQFGGGGTPPVIVSVSPLSGATGASVQFSAVVTGVGPFAYAWNFGSGATPNSSNDAQPDVTLSSTPGEYNCSLEVTNAAGSDTFDFALTVGEMPLASAVSPLGGLTGTNVQFSVTASGTLPFTYAWDFGGGATPGTSVEGSPTVMLGAPGVYDTASVTVTNAFGESFLGFSLTVTSTADPPVIFSVMPTAGAEFTEVTVSATVVGSPPLSYSWDFGGAATPSTYSVPVPTVRLNGAGVYPCSLTVDNFYGSDIFNFDFTVTAGAAYDEVEDNDDLSQANPISFPLVSFRGHCGGPGGYDGDDDDYFTFNALEDDYLSITMTGTDDSYDLDIALLDGNGVALSGSTFSGSNEAFGYQFQSADIGPFYLRVYAYDGSGEYELNGTLGPLVLWDKNVIDDSTSNYLSWSTLTYTGGYPGCFYMDIDNYDVYFAYSDDADGMGAWTIYPVDVSPDFVGEYLSSGDINGYPCAAYTDLSGGIKFAICTTSDGSGTWNVSFVDNQGLYDPSVAQINGYPAVAYEKTGPTLNYAINSATDGSGTWVRYPVDIGSGAYYTSMVALPNGNPGIFYNAYNSDAVRFATCDTWDGSGTWTNSTVLLSNVYPSNSAAIVDGRPAVATIASNERPNYLINSQPDGSGSWDVYPLSSLRTDSYISLAMQDGKPAVIFQDFNDDVYYLKSVVGDGAGPWSVSLVLRDTMVNSNRSLGWINNKPACVFREQAFNPWVGFAAPPD